MTQEEINCYGCGIKLQSESNSQAGYVPASALEKNKENGGAIICQRCFRIKNYNEAASTTVDQDDFLRVLNNVGHTNSLIVHIVDLFDFEGSLISGLHRFVGANPVIAVINKIDLLPKVTNWNRLVNWVQRNLKEQGLKTVDVVLISAKKNIGFERLIQVLEHHRQGRDIYVVGATNVGKSSMINRLIRDYSDLEVDLTTSRYPGTTLDLVKIPLSDGKSIIDTPGIVYPSRLTEIVDKSDLEAITPSKPLKPMIYQLNEGQTLFFGGFARFDFVRGERQSFTVNISSQINIHRTKLEKADTLYAEHKGELLSPPNEQNLQKLPELTKHMIRISKGETKDILISGLCWITVNGSTGAEIVVHAPKGIKVVTRNSLI